MTTESVSHWAERARMEFIERVLYWRGWINRRDLRRAFGISAPQATNDLVAYSTMAAGAVAYNVRAKRYEAGAGFVPRLIVPDLWGDLGAIAPAVWEREGVPLLAVPELPVRGADAGVMQAVSRAIFRQRGLRVKYWSLHSGTAEERGISPRALAHDGLRVHVRALCHRDGRFKDFNLGRIEAVLEEIECPQPELEDREWTEFVAVEVVPHEGLSPVQREALARDYRMEGGVLRFRVRRALVLYSLRRLGFVEPEAGRLPVSNESRELVLVRVEG